MKRVVILAGPPAVGKKSLALRLKREPATADGLGFRGSIRCCGLNLLDGTGTTITPSDCPTPAARIQALRNDLLGATEDNVVYVWQKAEHFLVDELLDHFANATHEAILLWLPFSELLGRVNQHRPNLARNWGIATMHNYAQGKPVSVDLLRRFWEDDVLAPFGETAARRVLHIQYLLSRDNESVSGDPPTQI